MIQVDPVLEKLLQQPFLGSNFADPREEQCGKELVGDQVASQMGHTVLYDPYTRSLMLHPELGSDFQDSGTQLDTGGGSEPQSEDQYGEQGVVSSCSPN